MSFKTMIVTGGPPPVHGVSPSPGGPRWMQIQVSGTLRVREAFRGAL